MFQKRKDDVLRPMGLSPYRSRDRRGFRWAVWAVALVFTPIMAMGAYQPGFLLPSNNLADVASAATSWANLGGGTAGKKAASDNTKATVASISGSITSGHIATFADTSGTVQDGGVAPAGTVSSVTCGTGLSGGTFTTSGTCAVAPIVPTVYTGTSPVTLASSNNLYEIVEMATPAALTINLPASPADGTLQCVKDGLKNFATNNATIKTTDSSTIDKVTGSTGFVMNQNGQQNCFYFSSTKTNWYVF